MFKSKKFMAFILTILLLISSMSTMIVYGANEPEVSVANSPDTPVTASDSLILDVRSEASAVAGKTIEIWAMPKGFEYSGTVAIPVSLDGEGYKFSYAIPQTGFILSAGQQPNEYRATIPFSSFVNAEGVSLASMIASNAAETDDFRAYRVTVEAGAFVNSTGVGNERFDESGAFFSKSLIRPTVASITPAHREEFVPASGEIVIEFTKQMSKAAQGIVTLTLIRSDALAPGTWSADGKTYTVSYSGLAPNAQTYILIDDFLDADNNATGYSPMTHFFVTGPTVTVGNPMYTPVTGDDGLILNFDTEVTAVAGQTITIWPNKKIYEYSGTDAIPVNARGLLYTFKYTIPESGLPVTPSGERYTVTIPFSDFKWDPNAYDYLYPGFIYTPPSDADWVGMSLKWFMNSTDSIHDLHRGFHCDIPTGAFVDRDGADVRRLITSDREFFSKYNILPTITSVTPASGTQNVETSGTLTIEFSRQMSKKTAGSISLSPSVGTLSVGTWSEDGTIYTAEYSCLQAGTEYTVSLSGFSDPDGNAIETYSLGFQTEPAAIPGDVSLDDVVDVRDAVRTLQYLAGNVTFSEKQRIAADVNGDGKVTVADVIFIMQMCVA